MHLGKTYRSVERSLLENVTSLQQYVTKPVAVAAKQGCHVARSWKGSRPTSELGTLQVPACGLRVQAPRSQRIRISANVPSEGLLE